MKNLATINTEDFTITENGDAFIGQTKAGLLVGKTNGSVRFFFNSTFNGNVDISQGLTPENLQEMVLYFSLKGEPQAIETLKLLTKAGAKAFIYHEAGYSLKAEPKPPTALELAKHHVILLEALEKAEAEKAKVQDSFTSTRGKLGYKTRQVNGLQRDYGQSEDFIPVAVMRKRFPEYHNAFQGRKLGETAKAMGTQVKKVKSLHKNSVNQYPLSVWLECYPFLENMY